MSRTKENSDNYFLTTVLIILAVTSMFAIITTKWLYNPPETHYDTIYNTITSDDIHYDWITLPNTSKSSHYDYIIMTRRNETQIFVDGMGTVKVLGYVSLQNIYQYTNYDQWELDIKNNTDWWTSQGYGVFIDDWMIPPNNSNFSVRLERIMAHVKENNQIVFLPRVVQWNITIKSQQIEQNQMRIYGKVYMERNRKIYV
jgi:hypothetical protein